MSASPGNHLRHSHPQRWITLTGVFTLLQSGLILSGAAVGLSLYTCSLKTSSSAIWQTVRLYYFSNVHCSSDYYVNGSLFILDGINNAAYRTMIIMILYTIISSVLFIGSFLLLVSAIQGKQICPDAGRILHYPWQISLVIMLTLDFIATIVYCVDFASTTDFTTVMGFLNIKPDGRLQELDPEILSVPPVIMTLLISKGVILWIIDFVIFILMIKQFKNMFLLRQQAEVMRAHLANTPSYLWPPEMLKEDLHRSKRDPPPQPAPIIPRLVNLDGIFSGVNPGSKLARASSAHMSARYGYNYESPVGPVRDSSLRHNSSVSTPTNYGGFPQDVPQNWYHRSDNIPPRDDRYNNNILRRDDSVFY